MEGGHLKFLGNGDGVLKAKILEAKYQLKVNRNFLVLLVGAGVRGGGGGAKLKTFHGGSMRYFLELLILVWLGDSFF